MYNVHTVVRLNKKIYERNDFIKNGIAHHELFFPDGTTPSDPILFKFLQIAEEANGTIAVHWLVHRQIQSYHTIGATANETQIPCLTSRTNLQVKLQCAFLLFSSLFKLCIYTYTHSLSCLVSLHLLYLSTLYIC